MIAVDKNDPLLGYPLAGRYAKGKPNSIFAEQRGPRMLSVLFSSRGNQVELLSRHLVFERMRSQRWLTGCTQK